jgi:hypothetical protein
MYVCPVCERPINQATEICPYCGTDLVNLAAGASEEPPKKPNLLAIVARWGVLLAAMWVFLWFIMPERSADRRAQAEAKAVSAIREIQAVLADYALAQGSFPGSLEVLGERVRPAAQQAQGEGYRILYSPGHLAPDGTTRSYTLEARAGHYGYRSFYTDESGVLRATRENRPANAQDPPL